MSTLCKTYHSERDALHALETLRDHGNVVRDVRLLRGRRIHDIRAERAGGFAGPVGPQAPVGTFANARIRRWRGVGTFRGDADVQRQGSFADADLPDVVLLAEVDDSAPDGGWEGPGRFASAA